MYLAIYWNYQSVSSLPVLGKPIFILDKSLQPKTWSPESSDGPVKLITIRLFSLSLRNSSDKNSRQLLVTNSSNKTPEVFFSL